MNLFIFCLFSVTKTWTANGGIKWGCCLGCCRGTAVEEIPRRQQARPQSSMTFMDINQSRPAQAWTDRTVPRRNPKADQALDEVSKSKDVKDAIKGQQVNRGLSYHSCQSIVTDLPLSKYRNVERDEKIRDQLIRNCVRRWHELNGDVPPDPRLLYRPSDSRISNLVIFKLDGTVVDQRKISSESYKPQVIRQYNKADFVFNQITTRHDPHLAMLVRTLVIYRKGLMQMFHTVKSEKTKRNSFDIALIGNLNFDSVFNAVAMETYYNWYYLRSVEQKLTSDRVQELQLNFVFAQKNIPQTHLGRYSRVIIVDSKSTHIPAKLCVSSQIIRIKVQPFLMIPGGNIKDSVLRNMYNQRNLGDNSMDKVMAFLMDIDINADLVEGHEWVVIGQDQLYNDSAAQESDALRESLRLENLTHRLN